MNLIYKTYLYILLFYVQIGISHAQTDALEAYTIDLFGSVPEEIYCLKVPKNVRKFICDFPLSSKLEKSFSKSSELFSDYRDSLSLNDWLMYKVVHSASKKIFPNDLNRQEYFCYKIFINLNYDVGLRYDKKHIYFQVNSLELPFNTLFWKSKDGYYVLPHFLNKNSKELSLYSCGIHNKSHANKKFSFSFDTVPQLGENKIIKTLTYRAKTGLDSLCVQLDRNYLDILSSYPEMPLDFYFSIPMSRNTRQAFFDAIKNKLPIKGEVYDTLNSLRYLLSLSRTLTHYEPDSNENKVLSFEEYLVSEGSDCEDRTIFLYLLVKLFFDLDMIAVRYKDHINLAICLPGSEGNYITYKGVEYTFFEPSDSSDASDIGYVGPYKYKTPIDIIDLK